MTTTLRTRALSAAAAVLTLGLGLSACGDDDGGSAGDDGPTSSASQQPPSSQAPGGDDDTPEPPPATTTEPTEPTEPDTTAPTESGPPECTAADVRASYMELDAGAGSRFGSLTIVNDTDAPCFVEGFGGLSYVGNGDGEQVGAAADRDKSTPAKRIVLPPDGVASSEVREVSTGNYDEGECGATAVDGFRLYLPDETESLFVKHRTDACTNADVHLLSHRAFVAG